jgi:hypothetical protein
MTLIDIMYAIGYGEGISKLKRKEGARRVKQAQKMISNRNMNKKLTFGHRYGISGKALAEANQTCLGIERANQERKALAGHTFKVLYGSQLTDVYFEGIEDQLKAQGYKETH